MRTDTVVRSSFIEFLRDYDLKLSFGKNKISGIIYCSINNIEILTKDNSLSILEYTEGEGYTRKEAILNLIKNINYNTLIYNALEDDRREFEVLFNNYPISDDEIDSVSV